MSVAFETIQIPKQIYARLRHLADQEKVEPINLIERWLEWALVQENAETLAQQETIAPIYRLHEHAKDLGMTDFAQQIDHYLYGHDKQ